MTTKTPPIDAAAPDMLAALKALEDRGLLQVLLDMDEATREAGEVEIAGPTVRQVLAAIAKVEGRS